VAERDEYLLGTDAEELERLRFQHEVWARAGQELFERAGLGAGDVVFDLGCGPGFTSLDLARRVLPGGRVSRRLGSRWFRAARPQMLVQSGSSCSRRGASVARDALRS
jgi:hypothetical protein